MKQTIFPCIAAHYDCMVAHGHFDYQNTVEYIASHLKREPQTIADLAAGAGYMARALKHRWPRAKLRCEEASRELVVLLNSRLPGTAVHRCALKHTAMKEADLVTIASSSLNSLSLTELEALFQRIRLRGKRDSLIYIDVLLQHRLQETLNGEERQLRVWGDDSMTIISVLSRNEITHKLFLGSEWIETNFQHVCSKEDFEELLKKSFEIVDCADETTNMRTRYLLTPRIGRVVKTSMRGFRSEDINSAAVQYPAERQ